MFYNLLWSRFYGGYDIQGGKGVAIDFLGNVYQTGYIMDGPYGRNDGILIKSSNSGIQIWNKTFGMSGDDGGFDLCTDSKNDLYVVGTVDDDPIDHQDKIIVLKYDSSGHQLWNKTWSEMSRANGRSITIDSEDNVYVAGHAGDLGSADIVFIKYFPNGTKIWQRTWGGDNYEGRYGLKLALDSQDYLFVAAQTNSFGAGNGDAVLIKYDKFGNQLWNKTWGGVSVDGAEAIAIDSKDNVFIAGYTDSFSTNGYRNLFIVKFNNSGKQIWNNTWTGIGGAYCNDMIVDSRDNILLTGYTYNSMTELVYLLICNGKGEILWNTTWGDESSMMNEGWGIAVDFFDNIYLSGYVDSYGEYDGDIFLLKYSQTFVPDPFELYSNAGEPDSDGIFNLYWFKSDKADNYSLYVYDQCITKINSSLTLLADQTASSPCEINVSEGIHYYIVVAHNNYSNTLSNCIKVEVILLYESPYNLEWKDIWGGSVADYGRGGIVVDDDNGYIYTTGSTYSFGNGGYDIFINKYNLLGEKIWTRFWGTTTHENAHDITLDSSGNIYITGYQGQSGYHIFLLKYDSNGNYQWHSTWDQAVWDEGYGVAVDKFGYIYVTGRTTDDFVLLKYNSAGNLVWSKIETSLHGGDDIVIDESGFIYICGRSDIPSNKYLSKYNSNGVLIWTHFWGDTNIINVENMVIDNLSNFYITGRAHDNNDDAFIVKLDSSGLEIWNITWGTSLNEWGSGIALDHFGNIYLTGEISLSDERDTFLTKFDNIGKNLWKITWGGSGYDDGDRIAIDITRNIYITGTTNSYGAGDSDAFILKYSFLPGSFQLTSNADFPDQDGNFNLSWTNSFSADNYSIYVYDKFITEINSSLTLLADQTAISPYEINTPNGIYYYIVVADNNNGNTLSNCIEIIVEIPPGSFSLSSDADTPDTDGLYNLIWTSSSGADNYSIYVYDKFITEINSSLTLLADQTAISPYEINTPNGIYYYIVVADNNNGNTLSNCIEIIVELPPSSFFLSSDAGNPDIDGVFNLTWTSSSGVNNYSIYTYDQYITHINSSLTLVSYQTAVSPYEIDTLQGVYYYIVVAHNNYGNTLSNCISVVVELLPSSFSLSSDADNPDTDGLFYLIWTSSSGADNYSVYAYNRYITEINSSLILLSDQSAVTPYEINASQGVYYYIAVSHNNYGNTLSNCIKVVVEILPGSFFLSSDAGTPDIDGLFNLIWTSSSEADNYSIYFYDQYITEINISLTLVSDQSAISPYQINVSNGIYYYIIVAHNFYGNSLSNCIKIVVKIPPGAFFLSSNAGTPDIDGVFSLIWTNSIGADNYSIYFYDQYITEINGSLNLLSDQIAISPYQINVSNGIYYYIIVAHNFYGNSLSNCIEIVIQIDNVAPIIIINLPFQYNLFGFSAPNYDITIFEENLDRVWYRLNNGTVITENVFIYLFHGFLEQDIWEQVGNGTVKVEFYVNDTLGNLGHSEILIRKDILAPKIDINLPIMNDLFGYSAPSYDLSILDGNLDKVWYRLISELTITDKIIINTLYGVIMQDLWDQIGNGTLIIQLFANDTIGNIGYSEVLIRKDIEAPEISIVEPSMNDVFEFAPVYEITVVKDNLDTIWYTLDGGETNYTITELIGIIDQEYWNSLPNGYITIRFYANDTLGNINYDDVIIVKTTPSIPPSIPGYNICLLLCIICIISVITIKYRIKKSSKQSFIR